MIKCEELLLPRNIQLQTYVLVAENLLSQKLSALHSSMKQLGKLHLLAVWGAVDLSLLKQHSWVLLAILNPRKHLSYTSPNSNLDLSIQSPSALSMRPHGFEQGLGHAACTQKFYHLHYPLKVSYQQILGSKQNAGTKISSRKILNCQ